MQQCGELRMLYKLHWLCQCLLLVFPSSFYFSGEGPKAHLQKLAECIRWSYGAGIVLRLGNIARLELNYCIPMGVQSGDRYIGIFMFRFCSSEHTQSPFMLQDDNPHVK